MTDVDLRHHGDAELAPGLVDCAVNVRGEAPAWLRAELAGALADLAGYPDDSQARAAIATRHGRDPDEVLVTVGAAEAFVLIARAVAARAAVVVHPQFTEPEVALRAAGRPVERVVLGPDAGFRLDPALVPADADLVVVGNPTNPTGVLHSGTDVAALARPGRVTVVDEAFADFVPGEPASLAARSDLPGLVVVRSLTKMWGLAGLRVGYLLAEPALVARLRAAQPPWAVSSPALAAAVACCSPRAVAESGAAARRTAVLREHLTRSLQQVPGVEVADQAAANFVLARVPGRPDVHGALRRHGFAVRRCDTFPGLGPDWLRVTVRDRPVHERLAAALRAVTAGGD